MLRYCCLFIVCACTFAFNFFQVLANDPSEGEFMGVPWYTEEALFGGGFHPGQLADTMLSGFQQYRFHHRDDLFYAGKGNVGHALRHLRFDPILFPAFSLFPDPMYPGNRFSLDGIRYYRPQHVFSELFYVLGSENEQLFYAKHNQRLHERVYAGVKYQTVNSPGFYSRMGARNAGFLLYLDAEPVERYQVSAGFIVNRLINSESGGLKDHLAFEEDEVRDSVFLQRAESRTREIGFRIRQSYRALYTTGEDTLSPKPSVSLGEIHHAFTYKRQAFLFDEPLPPSPHFYGAEVPESYYATYDSTLVHTISNKVSWSNIAHVDDSLRYPFHIQVYVRHWLLNIRQPLRGADEDNETYTFEKSRYSQFEHGIRVVSDPSRFVSFNGYANYIAGGYNDGDYGFGGNVYLGRESKSTRLNLHAAYAEQEPPYFFRRYRSNYVVWENDGFRKSRTLRLGVRLHHSRVQLEGNYFLLNRAHYMDRDAYPRQHDHSFSVISAGLSTDIAFSFVRTRHRLLFQYIDETEYERFPRWISYHSVYADFSLFDKALHAHAGIDLRYNAPYKPMAYMPINQLFYIQDQYKSNHELLLDVFINARISRARLFVKYENLLGLILQTSPIYDTPFYPLPENMFKFGVSWMFFD